MKLVKVCAPVAAAAVLAVGGFMFSNQTRDAFAGAPTAANASVEQAAAHTEPSLPSPGNGTIPGFDELIGSLVVVDELPEISGYERDCGKGKGCVFGTAWTDKYEGALARNGCDTRNDVLGAQLVDVEFKPGTRDCKVVSGTLNDPYTGNVIDFTTANPQAVQIDHVYPLARAWRAGASAWSSEQRVSFANDTDLNLLAAEGKANQSKSDKGPDTWLPANSDFRCEYVTNYLTVASTYRLMVTAGDIQASRTACGLE